MILKHYSINFIISLFLYLLFKPTDSFLKIVRNKEWSGNFALISDF